MSPLGAPLSFSFSPSEVGSSKQVAQMNQREKQIWDCWNFGIPSVGEHQHLLPSQPQLFHVFVKKKNEKKKKKLREKTSICAKAVWEKRGWAQLLQGGM